MSAMLVDMGEQSSNYQTTSAYAASSPRAARAYAAIMDIARAAAETGNVAVFGGYLLAAGAWVGAGGWVYETSSATSPALAHGRRKFAQGIVDGRFGGIARAMAEHYEKTMPADDPTPDPDSLAVLIGKRLDINYGVSAGRSGIVKRVDEQRGTVTIDVDGHDVTCDKLNVSISASPELTTYAAEARKLDGYYDVAAGRVPHPLDVVQLPYAAIGVVERVSIGGEALVRTNRATTPGSLETHPVGELRAVPPIAFELADVPGAVDEGNVPRDFAMSELSQRAVMRARRVAPDARLTLAAIKTDDRYEYGRAYVYAVASIIDATRLIAANCPNEQWHESAPARRLQRCASCDAVHVPVRTSAVEVLADGSRVPVGEPRETMISREALDKLYAETSTPEPSSFSLDVLRARRVANIETLRSLAEQLDVPLDELAPKAEPEPARATDPATDDDVEEIVERLVRRAQYLALRKVLDILDGWIKGAAENVEGGFGEIEAIHRFHSVDIRTMVADAARELRTADPTVTKTPS